MNRNRIWRPLARIPTTITAAPKVVRWIGIALALHFGPTVDAQQSSLLYAPTPRSTAGSIVPVSAAAPADRSPPAAANPASPNVASPIPPPGPDQSQPSAAMSQPPARASRTPQGMSPYGGAAARGPVSGGATLPSTSWTYRPEPRMRSFGKNDIITVRVDEIARMLAEGEAESRKNTLFRGILTDWITFSKGRLRPDAQPEGDPSVGTQSNDTFRSQSTIESRESLTFNIAATVVDVRPNGNLVLEARKSYRVNDNLWETSLTGICRVEDIGPDNVVLSRDLIDMQIRKEDQGHLRDKYRRGWFSRWLDNLQPF